MRIINLTLVIMLSGIFTSCDKDKCIKGEGETTSKILSIERFTGIALNGSFNVSIIQGPEQEVKAIGQSNIIDRIKRDVSNNIWGINLEKGCYKDFDLEIQITTSNINDIQINGSGNVTIYDLTDQEDLSTKISGSGNVYLNGFSGCEYFSVDVSGSGNITCYKNFTDLKELQIKIDGSGNYNGSPNETNECNIEIKGSGNSWVNVKDKLDVNIVGSGNVYYKGHPMISKSISGSGEVIDDN